MSAEYNLPLHVSTQNGDDYVIEDSYPHDGVTSPGMGWDGQSDGGGKFRLKRRRRCGQCGPCQVKENCNKCQYCLRKDVLKQACVYRKCVYLRKPVPRFRQEPTSGGGASHNKSAPTPPRKPTTTPVPPASSNGGNSNSNSSSNTGGHNPGNNTTTPAPASAISSPASVPSNSSSHPSELSSCRLNQSPFAALSAMQGMNSSVLDPLRHRMMEHQHRSSLFDSMSHHHQVLDHAKQAIGDMSRYPGGPAASGAHCKLDQSAAAMNHTNDMNLAAAAAAAAAASPLNSMSSHHAHHQSNKTSGLSTRDPYFPTMDTWSSMSYALPRATTWATSTLPNHHAAAAAYGFQQHSTPFPSSFTPSSCRLGLPDAGTSRFGSPAVSQHTFHHSMGGMAGFSQDLSHATANHANHANMRSMNAPFYPPPPHIPPSSIPSFPGLGQFPTNQASFGPTAYPMHPHAHMYPSGFYSTFRTATEPQIYHAHVYPSQNPFKHSLSQIPSFSSSFFGEKSVNPDKTLGLGLHKSGELNDLPFGYNAGGIEVCGGKNKLGNSCHSQVEEILYNKLSQADNSNAHSLNIPSLSKTFPDYFEKYRADKRRSVGSKFSKLAIKKSISLLHHSSSNGRPSCKPSLNQQTSMDTNSKKLGPGRVMEKGSRKSFQSRMEIDKDLMDRLNQLSHVSDSATCQHHNELTSLSHMSDSATCQHHNELTSLSHGRLDEIFNSDDVDNTQDMMVKCDDLAFIDNISSSCAPQSPLPPSTLSSSLPGKKLPPVISTAAFISSNVLPSFQPAAQVTDINCQTDELVKSGRIPHTKSGCIRENPSSSISRRHLNRSSPCLKSIKLKQARSGETSHVFSDYSEAQNQADSETANHSAISLPKNYEKEQLGSDPTPPFTNSSATSLHSVSCPLWEFLSDQIIDPCSDPSLSNEQKKSTTD